MSTTMYRIIPGVALLIIACAETPPPVAAPSAQPSTDSVVIPPASSARPSTSPQPAPAAPIVGPIPWQESEPDATIAAIAEKRPLIIYFRADWCVANKELESSTWRNKLVRAEASRFIALSVDGTNSDAPA